jgi:molybdopterin-guanine dinucleotide biosynthesis protein A
VLSKIISVIVLVHKQAKRMQRSKKFTCVNGEISFEKMKLQFNLHEVRYLLAGVIVRTNFLGYGIDLQQV